MRLRLIVIDDIAPRGCVHYVCAETQLFSQFINFRASDARNVLLRNNEKHIHYAIFFNVIASGFVLINRFLAESS